MPKPAIDNDFLNQLTFEPLSKSNWAKFVQLFGAKGACGNCWCMYCRLSKADFVEGKADDGYYWFVGRADDVIKSSGYRIGPFEVESALMEHPAVLECAITAVPDPDRGQVVKATVILAKNYHANDELAKELQEHVKKVTAPYKYPRIIEFVTELPKTISGKIRRVQIREEDEKN